MILSVCGKGGSGKSTITALLAEAIRDSGFSVLVVDSDESNSGLFRILGLKEAPLPLMDFLGGKAAVKKKMAEPNIFRQAEIHLDDIPPQYIKKQKGIAMVCIGKILQSLEGCACPMGVLNREFLKKLRLGKQEIAVVDMEAGIEHFGRGIDEGVDKLVIVVEPSFESLTIAVKIRDLALNMKKEVYALLNKVRSDDVAAKLTETLNDSGMEIVGVIPDDPLIFDAGLNGHVPVHGKAFYAAQKVSECLVDK